MLKNKYNRFALIVLKRTIRAAFVGRSILSAFSYDLRRYIRYSSSLGPSIDRQNMSAMITERYHSIEKGLSLPHPRPAFGKRALGGLLDLSIDYRRQYGDDDLIRTVAGVLRAYLTFNSEMRVSQDNIPYYIRIKSFISEIDAPRPEAGTKNVKKTDVLIATAGVGLEFFESRSSIRQFDATPVSMDDIHFAVNAAMKSPAVCNRQFGKIHIFTDESEIAKLLEIQGGAKGFADGVTSLAVITSTLRSYWNASQRHQAWVDGGLFAMSFLLGLHATGLGAVALNWSKNPSKDKELRQHTQVTKDEAIIMMVAFGHLKDEFVVATSTRRSLDDVLILNPELAGQKSIDSYN